MKARERSRSQSKSRSKSRSASAGSSRSKSEESEYDHGQDETLDKQYTKLIEYKNNLYKIETLMSLEKDDKTMTELAKLKNNLKQAISYQEENIKLTQRTSSFVFNTERLLPEYVERVGENNSDLQCLASKR